MLEVLDFLDVAAKAAARKQGFDLLGIDIREQQNMADYALLVTADNPNHAYAVVDEVKQTLKRAGAEFVETEGTEDCCWSMLFTPGLVVHIFLPEIREKYNLEDFWKSYPRIELPDYEHFDQVDLQDEYASVKESENPVEAPTSNSGVQIIGLDLD